MSSSSISSSLLAIFLAINLANSRAFHLAIEFLPCQPSDSTNASSFLSLTLDSDLADGLTFEFETLDSDRVSVLVTGAQLNLSLNSSQAISTEAWHNASFVGLLQSLVFALDGTLMKGLDTESEGGFPSLQLLLNDDVTACVSVRLASVPWSIFGASNVGGDVWCSGVDSRTRTSCPHLHGFIAAQQTPAADARTPGHCQYNVCLNAGTCLLGETAGTFVCACPAGYTGVVCESALSNDSPTGQTCASVSCLNGGVCATDAACAVQCLCAAGFSGERCESVLVSPRVPAGFMCQTRPCFNNAACRPADVAPGFVCDCPTGWSGTRCEVDVDECAESEPCLNNGTCMNLAGGYACQCPHGFRGDTCETDVDECANRPCRNGGLCVDLAGAFKCECSQYWMGPTCAAVYDACASNPCNNNGQCTSQIPSRDYTCACLPGFSGTNCESNVDDCAGVVCPVAGEVCVDGVGAYECRCADGWTGVDCAEDVDECVVGDGGCRNGATCINQLDGFVCQCPPGFHGQFCETDIDECAEYKPCKFGICRNQPGGYTCFCQPGYMSQNCTEDVPECNSTPCVNGGVCVDSANAFHCLCPPPFTGRLCESVSHACISNPCAFGATCIPKSLNDVFCACPPAMTGKYCDQETQPADPCLSNPCLNGICVAQGNGSYSCDCSSTNYFGIHCDVPVPVAISVCASSPCLNGGTCLETSTGYLCACDSGFTGENCQSELDPCASSSRCENGGTCIGVSTGMACICPDAFSGDFCQIAVEIPVSACTDSSCDTADVDECAAEPPVCGPNAVQCINTVGSFNCVCLPSWTGQLCDAPLAVTQQCPADFCPPMAVCHAATDDNGVETFECRCPSGLAGDGCEKETTASFSGNSLLAVVTSPPEMEYRFRTDFRTTVAESSLLAAGDDILGRPVYQLRVSEDSVELNWAGVSVAVTTTGYVMNDGNWHFLGFHVLPDSITLTVFDSLDVSSFQERVANTNHSSTAVFTTKLGGASLSGGSSRDSYRGCLRGIQVQGKDVVPAEHMASSADLSLGCQRVDQCPDPSTDCGGHGQCIDLWTERLCHCARPFLPPDCLVSFPEATFGNEDSRSTAEVEMSVDERQMLQQATDISMMIRTTQANGPLVFVGSQLDGNPDTDTFLALELHEGQLRANAKLGGSQVESWSGGPRLDDGDAHLAWLSRHENDVKGFVDQALVFEGTLERPFPHPLLATHFFLAGFPEPAKRRRRRQSQPSQPSTPALFHLEAFTNHNSYKGTMQDIQVNDRHVVLFPVETATDSNYVANPFGQVKYFGSVLKGTVSDDTCAQNPCANGGLCAVTFNDFECTCTSGWMGKDCGTVDFCTSLSNCPDESVCQNTERGYQCVAGGTFALTSIAEYRIEPSGAHIPLFYTFSFDLRTRTQDGMVFSAVHGPQEYLIVSLRGGGLDLQYQLGTEPITEQNVTENVPISNGEWHSFKFTLLTEQSFVHVDSMEVAFYLDGRPSEPLSSLFTATAGLPDGALVFGLNLNAPAPSSVRGFKGCLRNMQFGNELPPISFLSDVEYGAPNVTHLKAQLLQSVDRHCKSDPECEIPQPGVGPCQNGASCEDLWNDLRCICAVGFEGAFCEVNIDDCAGNLCSENSNCIDGIANYSCQCHPGYTGDICDVDINECDSLPCQNGGICMDLIGKFECNCTANYTGDVCDILITVDCASSPCQNGAQCTDLAQTEPNQHLFQCNCLPGYFGLTCENEIDYCESSPCVNGATCNSFTNSQSYACNCPLGFRGINCEVNIDECDSFPCANDATCVDGIANFTCLCAEGWLGALCTEDVDECLTDPCRNNAPCENTPGNYTCHCADYFLGRHCEFAGSCLSSPCVRGVCVQEAPLEHRCQCPTGYEGAACDLEIDYCASAPCLQGGTCLGFFGGFNCSCLPGWTGVTCDTDIDECESSPCDNGAVCVNGRNNFSCDCAGTGFAGQLCTDDVDECAQPALCLHGLCANSVGSYECACEETHLGTKCDLENPCTISRALSNNSATAASESPSHKCENGAACHNPRLSTDSVGVEFVEYDCNCGDAFEGDLCQVPRQQVGSADSPPLMYIIGPICAAILLCSVAGCVVFVMVARKKRANRGTYSPSRQEMTGTRLPMGQLMKPPPQERLI